MNLHFVCTGNIFRSRLAEAYVASLLFDRKIRDVHISSSGTLAHRNNNGPIAWYTLRILHNNRLTDFMSPDWQKTTKKDIQEADFVIYMKQMHLDHCQVELGVKAKNMIILDVDDVFPSEILSKFEDRYQGELEVMKETDRVFEILKTKLDKFIADIF